MYRQLIGGMLLGAYLGLVVKWVPWLTRNVDTKTGMLIDLATAIVTGMIFYGVVTFMNHGVKRPPKNS